MLIVDDILLFPFRSILWIFRELHQVAQEELATEAETITAELSELYMMLETGKITEVEFDVREKELLDRLEKIEERDARIENKPDEQPTETEFDVREKELFDQLEDMDELLNQSREIEKRGARIEEEPDGQPGNSEYDVEEE